MAMVKVDFTRTVGAGMTFARVYIDKEYLPFVNDVASKGILAGRPTVIEWQLMGNLGATFTLNSVPSPVTPIASETVPSGGKLENFTVVTY